MDNSGELIDGTKFNGPDELKKALLDRKDLFVRNLVEQDAGLCARARIDVEGLVHGGFHCGESARQ